MSVHASSQVWKNSAATGTGLLMLLAIADFADDEGNAYPAVGTLAKKCRMSARNVQLILAELKALGELEVRPNEGPKGCNRYRIRLDRLGMKPASPLKVPSPPKPTSPPEARYTLKPASRTPEAGFTTPLKPTSPEPSFNRQETSIPPIPPKGGKSVRQPVVGLKTWIETVKASGQDPVPEGDPVFAYAEEVDIPHEFLRLAWLEFRHRYTQPEAKRYRDWRAVFRKAVRGNWLKLWWLDPGSGTFMLTTVGLQAERAHADRKAA